MPHLDPDQDTSVEAPTITTANTDADIELLEEELLVEEVSIDGMCGVY